MAILLKTVYILFIFKFMSIPSVELSTSDDLNLNEKQCTPGNDTILKQHSFKTEPNREIRLIWLGTDQSCLLILILNKLGQPSLLYQSIDNGETLNNKTDLLNNSSIIDFVVLSGENTEDVVYLSLEFNNNANQSWNMLILDNGLNFTTPKPLPFIIRTSIQIHPEKPWLLLLLGEKYPESLYQAYVSSDYGQNWAGIMTNVTDVKWDPLTSNDEENLFYILVNTSGISNESKKGFDLIRTAFNSSTFTVIHQSVKSFFVFDKFLYANYYLDCNSKISTILEVSTSKGRVWNSVQFLGNESCSSEKILDSSEGIIFIHCGSSIGTLYYSDSDGIIFTETLTHHVPESFYKMTSMRGSYITQRSIGNSSYSVVSFDLGLTWNKLSCVADKEDECYVNSSDVQYPLLLISPQTTQSTKDLPVLLSHGTTNPSKDHINLYASNDGGYSWFMALQSPHLYYLGLHGGLLVATAKSPDISHNLRYSTNGGEGYGDDGWKCLEIGSPVVIVHELTGPPGGVSSRVAVVSYREANEWSNWTITLVNFKKLVPKSCEFNDTDTVEYPNNISRTNCSLGLNETFWKLKMDSKCLLENTTIITRNNSVCPCKRNDFECDFGFYKGITNSTDCILNAKLLDDALNVCYDQESAMIETTGYRKRASSLCDGGWKPNNKEIKHLRCLIFDNEKVDENEMMRNAIISVIAMIVIVIILGMIVFFLHKLQILRRQIPTYRYSKLNQDEQQVRTSDETNETLVDLSSSEDEESPAKLLVQSQTVFTSNHCESNGFIPDTPLRPVNNARTSKSLLEDTDDELLQEV